MWEFLGGGAAPPPNRVPHSSTTTKQSTGRSAAHAPITPPSTPSRTFNEKVEAKVEVVPDSIIASIPKAAAQATELLDEAIAEIRTLHVEELGDLEAFKKHEMELKSTRKLVQRVRFQKGFHTQDVAVALQTLHDVVERLAASTDSLELVDDTMQELASTRANLLGSLQANIAEAVGNKIKDGVQVNGEIGGIAVEGRMMVTACGNYADNALQVNAPVRGDPDALYKLAAMFKRA